MTLFFIFTVENICLTSMEQYKRNTNDNLDFNDVKPLKTIYEEHLLDLTDTA
jgi:hypothetical protein